MQALVELNKIRGDYRAETVDICEKNNRYYLISKELWNKFEIDLSAQLKKITSSRESKTSLGKTALKGSVGAMAGSAYGNNKNALTGLLVGVASSIDTKNSNIKVTLLFDNGKSITAVASDMAVQILKDITSRHHKVDVVQSEKQQKKNNEEIERNMRFLNDAPRTYFEVKDEVEKLEKNLNKQTDIAENGNKFDERDKAQTECEKITLALRSKQKLLEELETRAKAIIKFGSWDEYIKRKHEAQMKDEEEEIQREILAKKVTFEGDTKIRKRLKISWAILVTFIIFTAYIGAKEDESLMYIGMVFLLAALISIIYIVIATPKYFFKKYKAKSKAKNNNKTQEVETINHSSSVTLDDIVLER